jgi:hypothetical protein
MSMRIRSPATGLTWNLSTDFRMSPNETNPNPELGDPHVWRFMQGTTVVHMTWHDLLGRCGGGPSRPA